MQGTRIVNNNQIIKGFNLGLDSVRRQGLGLRLDYLDIITAASPAQKSNPGGRKLDRNQILAAEPKPAKIKIQVFKIHQKIS